MSFLITMPIVLWSCDTTLSKYKPKNDDEKQIISLLNDYETARNTSDLNKLKETFHKDSVYTSEAPPSTFSAYLTRDWAG